MLASSSLLDIDEHPETINFIKTDGLLQLTHLEISVRGQFPHSFQACGEERLVENVW